MLTSVSRQLFKKTKVSSVAKTAHKSRSEHTASGHPWEIKPKVFSAEEQKWANEVLEKTNADPEARAEVRQWVDTIKSDQLRSAKFWSIFSPVWGYDVPKEPGLERDVFGAVAYSLSESWSELIYALKSYQAKLQQDSEFLAANKSLFVKGDDQAAAITLVENFIQSIPTPSETAKIALRGLVVKGYTAELKSGVVAKIANEFINDLKREVKVEVTTAHQLTPTEVQNYQHRFMNTASDERTSVVLTTKVDPTIIGGEIININGTVHDGSWKTQHQRALDSLAKHNSL